MQGGDLQGLETVLVLLFLVNDGQKGVREGEERQLASVLLGCPPCNGKETSLETGDGDEKFAGNLAGHFEEIEARLLITCGGAKRTHLGGRTSRHGQGLLPLGEGLATHGTLVLLSAREELHEKLRCAAADKLVTLGLAEGHSASRLHDTGVGLAL